MTRRCFLFLPGALSLSRPTAMRAAADSTRPAPEAPPGNRAALTEGQLFIPQGCRRDAEGPTLTVHLHGAAWVAEREFVRAGAPGVLVSVVLPGLSAAYAAKFRDPEVFQRILDEAHARLGPLYDGKAPPFRRVMVTSFSAGFGGVRDLLKDPALFARIDALVLADSLHAGFTGDPALRRPDPAQMKDFVRYAREAAAGRKKLILSHSRIRPEGYAGTTETADYLIAALNGEREKVTESWAGGLELESRFRNGGFEVYGFVGDTGAAHMKHLHLLGLLLERCR
jgi:hypothetical protein